MNNIVVNDLYDYPNRKIYQFKEGFKFSLDSILLAEFCKIKSSKDIIIDFCCGNAAIPLIISTKHKNKIYGVEIQPEIAKLANQSVEYNDLNGQISIINDNVLNILQYFDRESIDIITCNPPYFKINGTSLINDNEIKSIARHEITINLEQIIEIGSKLLKNNSYFYMVHRTQRLEEIISIFNKYNFSIKELQFVYTKKATADLVLIKALKGGKTGLKVNPPLYTNNLKTYQNIFEEK